MLGVINPQVQDLSLPFVELHEVLISAFFHLLEVHVNGSTPFWCISHSDQFCIICKLAECPLCPIIQVVIEIAEQYLVGTGVNLWDAPQMTILPAGIHATDHNPVSLTVFRLNHCPLI